MVDEDNRLHGEGETALQFSDGCVVYAYHGITLPEKYGAVAPSSWQAEWVVDEQNKQLKKILMKEIGAVRLCEELSLIEVETKGKYTLFKLDENTNVKAIYILKRINTETGEIKASSIPWMENNLDRAIQYAHQNVSAEDFPLPTD